MLNGCPLCLITSQNACDYFSRDNDSQGLERGRLVQEIERLMEKRDKTHDARWSWVETDPIAKQLLRQDHKDYLLWGQAFFDAPVSTLNYILKHIKEV